MITNLYIYFGVVGILSILAWITALVLLSLSARRRIRPGYYCFLVLGVAVTGWFLAKINSANVSSIEMDRRDEMAALAKARQAAEAVEDTGGGATLRFAEGDPEETMPEYRKKGRQVRDKGKNPGRVQYTDSSKDGAEAHVKYLRADDLAKANQLDRLNLLIVRMILLLAIGRVVADYLKRFNSTANGYGPIPIAGRWLNALFEKTHTVFVDAYTHSGLTPKAYAEQVVKKGESFIYFGENDPWQESQSLSRLSLGRWSVWTLPKLDYGDPKVAANGEFVLDAAWFGRCAVVVKGEDGFPLFEYMVELIALRHATGASARKTVHLVWDLAQTPTPDMILPLAQMAAETNIKLTVWSHAAAGNEYIELFEEHLL